MLVIHEAAVLEGIRVAFERAEAEGMTLADAQRVVEQNVRLNLQQVSAAPVEKWSDLMLKFQRSHWHTS